MATIIIDEDKIKELLTRSVEEVIELNHLKKRLLGGKELRIKLGIDPTSPNIHIGRAVVLWKLREFQDLGHKAVFIVGDFTGQIGDTSDKEAERPMLSEEQVKQNIKAYFNQAFKILDKDKTETFYNSAWLQKLGFLEVGKMADKFGLHEFSSRELIKKRIDAGKRVSLRELLYPLMQGYDSVAVKSDIELGGTDQKFNLLAGRVIQPIYNQEPQDIVITKFPLEGTDGRKMSSSWGNVINITDKPDDMFGKVMSIDDDLIFKYFELATRVSLNEIKTIEEEFKAGTNPRDIKKKLAQEIVTLYHGEREAQKAKKEWEKVFSKKEYPSEMEELRPDKLIKIVRTATGESSSNAKTLITQGAVKVNGEAKKEWDFMPQAGDVIQIGPRRFIKIAE